MSIVGVSFLGEGKWFGRWRQFCFYPVDGSIFTPGCMRDIIDFIEQLMGDRKPKGKGRWPGAGK